MQNSAVLSQGFSVPPPIRYLLSTANRSPSLAICFSFWATSLPCIISDSSTENEVCFSVISQRVHHQNCNFFH